MVRAYLRLARWPNALLAATGVLVGAWFALWTGGRVDVVRALAAIGAAIALTVTANAWNDAADVEIDRVVHPERPIPSGRITVRAARNVALLAAIAGTGLASIVSPALGVLSLVVAGLMIAYSPWLKQSGIAGNVTVALLASLPFLYGAWASGQWEDGLALVAWAFPLHFAREIAKDIDDVEGDAGYRRTVPLVWGIPAARILAIGALLCFVAPLPLFTSARWLLLLMLPSVCAIALGGWRLYRGLPGGPRALKTAMLLALCGILGALAFFGPRPDLS